MCCSRLPVPSTNSWRGNMITIPGIGIIQTLLNAVIAWFQSQAARDNRFAAQLEYDLKTRYQIQKDKSDDEAEQLEKEYQRLRDHGNPDDADRVLLRAIRTRSYAGWLRDFGERQGLQANHANDSGQPKDSASQG